jgi:hypothetical protein
MAGTCSEEAVARGERPPLLVDVTDGLNHNLFLTTPAMVETVQACLPVDPVTPPDWWSRTDWVPAGIARIEDGPNTVSEARLRRLSANLDHGLEHAWPTLHLPCESAMPDPLPCPDLLTALGCTGKP